ncbi:hypothetical protein Tco_0089524 [Tanacetum coccineum]
MTTLKFAETQNMVAFLSKPTECEGFKQIVDFLNARLIKYALTVNPTIYASCVKQLWSTVKEKTVNGEVQLQALVDGKKIIVTEASVRSDLQLDDEEGMDCLPNATIFEELTRIRYEKISQKLTFYKAFFSPQWKFLIHTILQCLSSNTTAWNEFSSTMASAIICLAISQKFNFSKYIFKSMVKNLENVSGKFLMYPRFVQVFFEKQLDDMSNHNRIYVTASHTKKIFGNMKRVGKGFSGRVTPLFPTMMVQAQEEMGEADEDVNEEMEDSLERAATTATSLDVEQDRGNINKTQSKATFYEPSFLGTSSGSGPRRHETMGDTIAQTRSENIPKHSNDPLLTREFLLWRLQRPHKLWITSLKRRVKKLEKRNKSRSHGLKRLYIVGLSRRVESYEDEGLGEEDASKQGRIDDIDANEDIYLVNVHRDEDMFGVNDLESDEVVVETEVDHEVVVETEVASRDVNLSVDEVTLAQALAALKTVSTRPRAKGLVIHEQEQAPTPTISSKDKAEFDEDERLAREKDEANVALTEEWNDIRAKIDADYQLAQRLQAQEQEELTDAEKPRLFVQLLEQRRKHFAAKRVEEKRNRPPTKELFDKAFTFVDYRTELVEESSKKAEVMEESSKKAEAEIAQESSSKRAG